MSWIEVPDNSIVGKFDLTTLNIDEAFLNLTSFVSRDLWLYSLSSACYSCPFTRLRDLPFKSGSISPLKIDTTFPTKYRFRVDGTNFTANNENDGHKFCDFGTEPAFGEFGVYNIRMETESSEESPNCTVAVAAEPVNIYFPLLLAIAFYSILGICICSFRYIRKCFQKSEEQLSTSTPIRSTANVHPTENGTAQQRQRLKSLDTFRGICIVVMIFVNFGGGKYQFLEHAAWDGITIADLVFPWFLWIMGVCVPIAIKSQVKRDIPKSIIFKNIAIRSVKLIGLGLFHNSIYGPVQFGEAGNLRIPGVLQRFGVCYLICSTLVLLSMTFNFRKPDGGTQSSKFMAAVQDITILGLSWILIGFIILIHFSLTFFLPVPGCPTGYMGPGGLDLGANSTLTAHCIGGAAGYIDHQVFTISHIYKNPTAKQIFHSGAYDPEGLLGTLTSIFQVWLGIQTGATMVVYPRPESRLKRWGIWAILTGLIATILCQGKLTGGFIPVNKNLWSISYVLATSCFANILLSVLYFVIDIKKWWTGSPFFESGMNSILLYLGHGVLENALPWRWTDGIMRTHCIRLIENLWATSLWVLIGIWLHCKKLYWSI